MDSIFQWLAEKSSLQQSIQCSDAATQKLGAQLDDSSESNRQKQSQIMSMADEIDSLQKDLIQSRQSSDSLRGTIANLDTELAAVREFFFFL